MSLQIRLFLRIFVTEYPVMKTPATIENAIVGAPAHTATIEITIIETERAAVFPTLKMYKNLKKPFVNDSKILLFYGFKVSFISLLQFDLVKISKKVSIFGRNIEKSFRILNIISIKIKNLF